MLAQNNLMEIQKLGLNKFNRSWIGKNLLELDKYLSDNIPYIYDSKDCFYLLDENSIIHLYISNKVIKKFFPTPKALLNLGVANSICQIYNGEIANISLGLDELLESDLTYYVHINPIILSSVFEYTFMRLLMNIRIYGRKSFRLSNNSVERDFNKSEISSDELRDIKYKNKELKRLLNRRRMIHVNQPYNIC